MDMKAALALIEKATADACNERIPNQPDVRSYNHYVDGCVATKRKIIQSLELWKEDDHTELVEYFGAIANMKEMLRVCLRAFEAAKDVPGAVVPREEFLDKLRAHVR